MNLENIIKKASQTLKNHNIHSHDLDAEVIISNIMGVKREYLITKNKIMVPEKIVKEYDIAIGRRIKKDPVAYIIGKKEFWSKDFIVNRNTLIPRPETEILVYKVIKYFKNKRINILDIGTGTGCILLSILKELNRSRGVGIDISKKAVQIAKINSKNFNLMHRSKFKVCDLENYSVGKYDLIVSNPPYILSQDMKNLSEDIINHEPKLALDGGVDGLDLIKKVIYKSNRLLKRDGLLALEIGFNQYRKVLGILRKSGFREIGKEYDYKTNVRCIISTKIDIF